MQPYYLTAHGGLAPAYLTAHGGLAPAYLKSSKKREGVKLTPSPDSPTYCRRVRQIGPIPSSIDFGSVSVRPQHAQFPVSRP